MANPIKIIEKIRDINDGVAGFIADGPSTGLPGWVRDRYRDRCNQFANLPPWARALGGPAKHQMNAMCTPYWDDNGWDGPALAPPPFEGGQCEGTIYLITWTVNDGAGGSNNFQSDRPGPLTLSRALEPGDSSAVCAPGVSFQRWTMLSSTTPQGLGSGCGVTVTNIQVSPLFGGPDNCGDPPGGEPGPGPNPPPDPGPLPGPEPTDDPRDPTGLPRIPIPPYEDPVFGPVPIDAPEDNPTGGGPPSGGDGLPGDPDAVGPEAGGAAGGEPGEDIDFGEPPEGSVWVGCVVEADVDPRYGTIPDTGPANTVYPTTLGNVSLIYEGYRGTNVRVLSKFTDLYRQVSSVVLTGCRVSGLPGVDLTVKPISAVTCPDNPCEED